MGKRRIQIIEGSDFDDRLVASAVNKSKVVGFAGNDTLFGNDDLDNFLYAGLGDDLIFGGLASIIIDGAEGDDRISAIAIKNQQVLGGSGNDDIDLNYGPSTFLGRAKGRIILDAGDGNDRIRYRNESASAKGVTTFISGGSGDDSLDIDRVQFKEKVIFDLGDGDDSVRLVRVPEPTDTFVNGGNGVDLITGEAISSLYEVRETTQGNYALVFRAYQINGIGYEQVVSIPQFEAIRDDFMNEYSLAELAGLGTELPWL